MGALCAGSSADHPGFALAGPVALALVRMAARSPRAQADVGAALSGAGIMLAGADRDALLKKLADAGLVEDLIPLEDGGLILTVTNMAMLTLGRA